MITVCLTHFRGLTLANLAAAMWSVRRQDLSRVEEIVVVDNGAAGADALHGVVDGFDFQIPMHLRVATHTDPTKTHAWSTNFAVEAVTSPWVLVTRADYLLDFSLLSKFGAVLDAHGSGWNGFVTSNGCHLGIDIAECERTAWRTVGPKFPGTVFDYTKIDAGVYLMRKRAFDAVGGLDERLTAWGHAQTEFQHRLWKSGVEFVRIPETLFFHPAHGGEKDLGLANQQLAGIGVDLKECWRRYEGTSPYGA